MYCVLYMVDDDSALYVARDTVFRVFSGFNTPDYGELCSEL